MKSSNLPMTPSKIDRAESQNQTKKDVEPNEHFLLTTNIIVNFSQKFH